MFCRILFRWRWSIPKVIWLWGIHTWEWIILPFNTISIIHILWGWTSINPNDVYVNQGIRVLICPLLLKAKAKEAAAALLPDVAATSEGFHDLSGGPTQWGLEGVWKGFLCCFFWKNRVFLRPEKWKHVVLILQFYTQHLPRHPSYPIPPPPLKNELQCLIDFFSHVGLGLKQITSIRPRLGFGAARDTRMPSLFINIIYSRGQSCSWTVIA